MAWISDAYLAAAVSEAGGLGIISGVGDTDDVRAEIKKVKSLTKKPFGINIMLMRDNVDEIAKLEKIEVTDKEANAEAEKLAKGYNVSKDEFLKQFGGIEILKSDLRIQKAIEVIKK